MHSGGNYVLMQIWIERFPALALQGLTRAPPNDDPLNIWIYLCLRMYV
jgi:hypothetical protein